MRERSIELRFRDALIAASGVADRRAHIRRSERAFTFRVRVVSSRRALTSRFDAAR
jgi:hypothetical protein